MVLKMLKMEITILSNFQIAETKTFQKVKRKVDSKIINKIENSIYPQLRENPFYGSNIKKLKGDFEGYYRYRIGNYRLFYLIENDKVLVLIVDLKDRKDAY
jgi:mRNA interferase RelE/StbE